MARIDAHVHAFGRGQAERRQEIAANDPTFAEMYADPKARIVTPDAVVGEVERTGFDGAVVAGFAFASREEIACQNESLERLAADARFACLATVNPALAEWERDAEAALGWTAGFGELRPWNQGWDPLGPSGHALCDMATAHNAVLLWHVSEEFGHEYPGKRGGISAVELWQLAKAHPGARMVAAHQGGGLGWATQMPEVRESLLSISFDTAATTLLYDEESVLRLIDVVGAERVLFGSDYPLLGIAGQYAKTVEHLDAETETAVGGGNARRLFFERRDE
jgi:hypothetical protein